MPELSPGIESMGPQSPEGGRSRLSARDPIAGLVSAVVALPDGLAAAAMVGVNPVFGLYANCVAPAVGGALTSSRLMIVATTSASAVAVSEAIARYPAAVREQALMLLVLMVGGFLAVLGLLRAGRMVKFVSHAVMTGFLLGVAVALILHQLPPFFGYAPSPGSELWELVTIWSKLGDINPHTAAIGTASLAILLLMKLTPFGLWAPILALMLPTLLAMQLGWQDVATVGGESPIPGGFPLPSLPDFSLLSPALVGSAFAIAVVIAIQGAGVSQSLVSDARKPPNISRDMIAQGAANCASSLFSGIAAGGSVGQTALNVSLGARSRWAGVSAGFWMIGFILLVPHLVALVPMSVLAAIMISAGLSALNWREALSIWRVGGGARTAIVVTFAASLVTSIPAAVGIGVLVTMAYFVLSSAADISVKMLVREEDGRIEEIDPPAQLHSGEVVILTIMGSLFFAGARTLQDKLPDPAGAERPVVILRLRGRSPVGSTLIRVLDLYADHLAAAGGALYLSGVGKKLCAQLQRSGKLKPSQVHVFGALPEIGVSTREALQDAQKWLAGGGQSSPQGSP